jgi:hypothetical protein
MSVKINSPKDCMDNRKVESFARSNGCEIIQAKGDHVKIKKDNQEIIFCDREMGFGLACKVFKFFKNAGLICIILALGLSTYLQIFDPNFLKSLVGG